MVIAGEGVTVKVSLSEPFLFFVPFLNIYLGPSATVVLTVTILPRMSNLSNLDFSILEIVHICGLIWERP